MLYFIKKLEKKLKMYWDLFLLTIIEPIPVIMGPYQQMELS